MANITGKATAITVLTPMKPWKSYLLRFLFRLISWGFFAKIQQRLIKLSFIHFAHWSILKRDQFPHLTNDQPLDHPQHDYLIFVSNFNGSWDQYIDAFSEVVPVGLDNIWKWSEKFPGSVPENTFFEYIRHNQYSSDYYYNATPGHASTDITSALTVVEELEKFSHEHGSSSPEVFAEAYRQFVIKIQNHLPDSGLTNWFDSEIADEEKQPEDNNG